MNQFALLLVGALLGATLFALFQMRNNRIRARIYVFSPIVALVVGTLVWRLNESGQTAHDAVELGLSAGVVAFARATPRVASVNTSRTGLPAVPTMIETLEHRLKSEPADAKGWSLLAQSYAYIGYESGIDLAIANAVRLGVDEAALRAQVAGVTRASTPQGIDQ